MGRPLPADGFFSDSDDDHDQGQSKSGKFPSVVSEIAEAFEAFVVVAIAFLGLVVACYEYQLSLAGA